jgi:hypothetical protein
MHRISIVLVVDIFVLVVRSHGPMELLVEPLAPISNEIHEIVTHSLLSHPWFGSKYSSGGHSSPPIPPAPMYSAVLLPKAPCTIML